MSRAAKAYRLLLLITLLAIMGCTVILFGERINEWYQTTYFLQPCTTEDSIEDCYWDANVQGNGEGTSFVVLDGQVYVLDVATTTE